MKNVRKQQAAGGGGFFDSHCTYNSKKTVPAQLQNSILATKFGTMY